MATLSEMTVQVLSARLAKKEMSLEEIQKEMVAISTMIKAIDEGNLQESAVEVPKEEPKPQLTLKQAFKKDEVICMICNKGFKTLKRHLSMAHNLKPGQYRKQFGIPATQSLAAKSYVESRRQMAIDRNLGDGLAKAREKRAANIKAAAPVVKAIKVPVPAKKTNTSAPAVRKKAAISAKVVKQK